MPAPPVGIPARELETLFDVLPDVVFFVKDTEGRYTHANMTLVGRLGLKRRCDVVGRRVADLFPVSLGGAYAAQDRRVLNGELIENHLEVHIFPTRRPGWCLTCKRPLRVRDQICGLVGISRDLRQPDGRHPTYDRLSRAVAYLQQHYAGKVRVQILATLADLSIAQLERHFRRVFLLTPNQVLNKLRMDAAMRRLQTDDSIAAIGAACGFADQSAFARRFKATVGMTPRNYRALATSGSYLDD